jgi:NTP pyrophosphatase (non-canonical NTP hydrolase)
VPREWSDEMSTNTDAIQACALEMYAIADKSGFHEDEIIGVIPANFGAWMANLHSEVSELWEAYRKGQLASPCDKGGTIMTCAEEELADIVIRAMDTAVGLGVDIGRAIELKSAYNRTRPFRHGGKKA